MHGTLGILEVFFQSPSASIKSLLTTLHLLGLVFGLGAASMLDLIILRFLIKNRVSGEHWNIIELLSKSVSAGLVTLWVSGIGFSIHYAVFDPNNLANPKIWAKVSIVAILTANGVFIHRIVLPQIRARIGRHLFQGMSRSRMRLLLVLGTISGTSWYVPLFLGAIPLFNFALSVPAILLMYALLVLGAIFTALIVGHMVLPAPPTVTIPRREYLALRRAARRSADRPDDDNQSPARILAGYLVLRGAYDGSMSLRSRFQFAGGVAVMICFTVLAGTVFDGTARSLASEWPSEIATSVPRTALASSATNIGNDNWARGPTFSVAMLRPDKFDEIWSALFPLAQFEPATTKQPHRRTTSVTETVVSPQPLSAAAAPVSSNRRANVEQPRRSPVSGVWAPDLPACSAEHNPDGLLRATINAEGAWAGDTMCIFKRKEGIQKGWKVVAACSNGGERWTANVRLVVDGNSLTWSSNRGTRTYIRCGKA